ncbi:MAG: hypothetical protein ACPLZH_01550, partial [Minisyncoccales bacterium]
FLVKTLKKIFFLKYPWDLFYYRDFLFNHFLEEKISQNVFVSKKSRIEGKVFIGKNSKILDKVVLKGPCFIGENCFLDENVFLKNTNLESKNFIGRGSKVLNSIFQQDCRLNLAFVFSSILGKNCQLAKNVVLAGKNLKKRKIFSTVKGKKEMVPFKDFGCVIGPGSLLGDNVFIESGVFVGKETSIFSSKRVKENLLDKSFF